MHVCCLRLTFLGSRVGLDTALLRGSSVEALHSAQPYGDLLQPPFSAVATDCNRGKVKDGVRIS
jgi:hypothetical protein